MFPNKLASALLILSIAACSSNSDSGRGDGGSSGNGWGASGGQGGSGQGCGFTSSDPCEDTCLNSTCCQQASVCTQSGCGDLIDCGLACETDACFDGCLEQYPGAVDPLINMYDCVDTCGCGGGGSGGNGGSGGGAGCGFSSTDTCTQGCIDNSCCSQATDCANSTQCTNLNACLGECSSGDDACASSCINANESGLELLSTFYECVGGCGC